MIDISNIEKAKKEIKNCSERPVVVKAQDDEFNRKILEYGNFDILLLDSGLNHVLARIAARNKIAIGIDLNELRKLGKREKAIILGKIIQNIKICRKANAKFVILNFKDKRDASSFFISIGASTKQVGEAIS